MSREQAVTMYAIGVPVLWKLREIRTKDQSNWMPATGHSSFSKVEGFRDYFKVEVE